MLGTPRVTRLNLTPFTIPYFLASDNKRHQSLSRLALTASFEYIVYMTVQNNGHAVHIVYSK